MPLLSEDDRNAIRQHFSTMEKEVSVTLTHPPEGPGDSGAILAELAGLTDRIRLVTVPSPETAPPSITVGEHGRVRFMGTPSGYEFSTLLTAIIDAGRQGTKLSPATLTFIEGLREELQIMVFVTPTCPHCPGAAVLAHRMAAHSPRISASVIEAQEFPDLATSNRVMGVPRTVVNGKYHAEGNMSETLLVTALSRAMASGRPDSFINLSEFIQ
jgi:alkyl hydroperoxide reductase subunit AhpF